MVKAAHLKPLDKTERLAPENLQRGCIWNTFVDKKSDLPTLQNMDVSNSKHTLQFKLVFNSIWFKFTYSKDLQLSRSVGTEPDPDNLIWE